MNIFRVVALATGVHVCLGNQAVIAKEQDGLSIKPVGVGLEYLTQEQDFSLTDFTVDNLLLKAALPANANELVPVTAEMKSVGVKADYWVKPYLNVFGSVSSLDSKAVIGLAALGLPDMTMDTSGNLYSAGATLAVGKRPYFGTLSYIHSMIDLEKVSGDNKADTFIVNGGVKTDAGVFTLGVMHQDAKAGFVGSANLPLLGQVNATANGGNSHKISYLAGYQLPLGKNFILTANTGFGERKMTRLEISKRF